MKKAIALILCATMILSGCSSASSDNTQANKSEDLQVESSISEEATAAESEDSEEKIEVTENPAPAASTETMELKETAPSFSGMDDPELLSYVENNVYANLVQTLDSDEYFVENVEAVYISQEYIDELTYNSQSNVYFGYTLEELNQQFQGDRYVFTLGDNGETTVKKMETVYDDSTERIIKNVAVGGGVILLCVTVSVVTAGAGAPAVSMIFAAAAKTGTTFALSSAAIGGAAATITTGYQTHDPEAAFKAGLLASSEGFKWGAISGAVIGGGSEAIALHGATLNGLTMNEAAAIQKESGYPLDVIKQFKSVDEYNIYKKASLAPTQLADGSWALLREINWKLVDDMGRTNVQRVMAGLAPIDSTGMPYELHHIGMKADSPLAILTNAEHHSKANFSILHWADEGKNVTDAAWNAQKKEFWNAILKMAQEAM